MLVKWYTIETSSGVKKVQGLGEKFVAESLNRFGIKWDRPKAIKTPFGNILQIFGVKRLEYLLKLKECGPLLKWWEYYLYWKMVEPNGLAQ